MKRIAMVVFVLALSLVIRAMAVENKGAEQIILDGGKRGAVHFHHHLHQNMLGDCKICHSLFPQEPGVIARLKQEEKLVPKQIMNKLCVKCHKAKKQAGQPAGPVTCTKCHHKG